MERKEKSEERGDVETGRWAVLQNKMNIQFRIGDRSFVESKAWKVKSLE